jgi:HEXXH motif-containing protein
MRIGVVALPTLGTLRMDLADAAGWARINSDGRREVLTVSAGSFSVELPMNANRSTRCGPAEWLPAARLRLPLGDVVLDVVLETADPFLGAICPGSAVLSRPSLAAWHRRLQSAWRILVRHHRSTAEALAAGLTTLVPLGESVPGRPVSAASGHAWGAIALSLPPDALSGAETLVHEFRHLVLSAVEDLTPLVSGSDDQRYYAPWRDDPRPLRGLLQGSYAFFGVTGFWRRQRQVGPSADRLRGELEFARGRRDVLDAVHCVAASSNLTETGQVLAHSMLASLAAWQHEPVSAGAQFTAAQASAAHRLRWRLAHLRPDQDVVEVTAQAWLAGLPAPPGTDKPPGTPEPGRTPSPIAADSPTPTPASSPPGRRRSALPRDTSIPGEQLSMAGDQETRIDDAGAAFMHVAAAARQGYLRRVVAGDSQAWVGLLLVRHQMAGLRPGAPLPERPELMVAVYERVRTLTGTAADPESLVEWFTRQR